MVQREQGLGDKVERALTAVGITKQRVTRWVGRECGCEERKERLNRLGAWAENIWKDGRQRAREHLQRMIEGWDD